jgi:hypothetical protein
MYITVHLSFHNSIIDHLINYKTFLLDKVRPIQKQFDSFGRKTKNQNYEDKDGLTEVIAERFLMLDKVNNEVH